MLIDPDQVPHLAVQFMNEDHAEEARLVNAVSDQLAALRAGRAAADAVKAALESLYVHTREHFAREEAAMRDASFPAFSFHQAEHVRILGELGEAQRRFAESGAIEQLESYLATLPPWLDQHIRSMDAVTARYVAEWGG